MTTATLSRPRSLFLPGATRRGFVAGLFGTLIVGLFVLVGLAIGIGLAYEGRVMAGVRVEGVDIGGLDRAAAGTRLRNDLPSLSAGSATVVVDGSPASVSYEELGRGYQMDATLDAALAVANGGNPLSDGLARLRALVHPTAVAAVVHGYDPASIDAAVARIANEFAVRPVSAGVRYDPASGYVVTPATPGRVVDADALRAALAAAVTQDRPGNVTVAVSTTSIDPLVSTVDADAAAAAARRMSGDPLQLGLGDSSFVLDAATIRGLVHFELTPTGYQPVVAREALQTWLIDLAPKVARDAQDAGFTWGANGVAEVTPAVEGTSLDVDRSLSAVADALAFRGRGALVGAVVLATTATQPSLTTAAAQVAADSMVRLSTWTTYYVPGTGNYWGANISIPAMDLDKMVIAPGEWFSFWDDIGPISTARGYGCGGAIIGGRSVACGVLAGGICSTSTTLFNAAMRAGLEIGDRTNHYYYISRYPTGLDATVFQTDTYEVNMTFRNDTPDPIVIRSYTGRGWVRFDIWGVPTGRTVTLSAPVISNPRSARDTTVLDPSLKPGTSVRAEYPHDGFDATVTRTVTDADGTVIWKNVWFSHYSAVNGITNVGPAKPKPAPTATPEPSPGA